MHRDTHQYDHIHSSLHQQVQSIFVVIVRSYGSATQQLLARVFGGQREISVLLQICASNDGHQTALFIHNGQFTCGNMK